MQATGGSSHSKSGAIDQAEEIHDERPHEEEGSDGDSDHDAEKNIEGDGTNLTGRQKKLFELRLKMVGI